jgi:hypothetical protein
MAPTTSNRFKILTAVLLILLRGMDAFVPRHHERQLTSFSSPPPALMMSTESLESSIPDAKPPTAPPALTRMAEKITRIAAATAVAVVTTAVSSPLAPVLAEEVDGYEYGAVNAPIGIAWAVGKETKRPSKHWTDKLCMLWCVSLAKATCHHNRSIPFSPFLFACFVRCRMFGHFDGPLACGLAGWRESV